MLPISHDPHATQAHAHHEESRYPSSEIEKHIATIEALQAKGVTVSPNTLLRHLGLRGYHHAAEIFSQWQTRGNEAETMQAIVVSLPPTPVENGTDADEATLARYEEIVDRGFKYAWEAGEALKQIRDRRLFLRTHETFEGYVRDRFQVHRSQAYRWIQAAQVVENLLPIGDMPLPKHESQIRPLLRLSPEHQAAAWQHACASAPGAVTAATVKASVDSIFPSLADQHGGGSKASVAGQASKAGKRVQAACTTRRGEDSGRGRQPDTNRHRAMDRFLKTGEQIADWLAEAVSGPANLVAAAQHLLGAFDDIFSAKKITAAGDDSVELAIEFLSKLFPAKKGDSD